MVREHTMAVRAAPRAPSRAAAEPPPGAGASEASRVVGSEVVGLTPAKALIDCAEHYLKLENFDCHNQVMEYHLVGME